MFTGSILAVIVISNHLIKSRIETKYISHKIFIFDERITMSNFELVLKLLLQLTVILGICRLMTIVGKRYQCQFLLLSVRLA
jgi:hypothetical protein